MHNKIKIEIEPGYAILPTIEQKITKIDKICFMAINVSLLLSSLSTRKN